ncbi:hypothetical protein [Dyadobacter psychrophilus]|nr:hypothetical protein [Dyadobacter psychrophilus]
MKKIILLSLIAIFVGCKESNELNPVSFIPVGGLEDFSVPGVGQKNIKITDGRIVIHLPANYSAGDFIKPVLKASNDYKPSPDISNGFSFEGKSIKFDLKSATYSPVSYEIYVIPANPIQAVDHDKDYELIVQEGLEIDIPLQIRGTAYTITDSGSVVDLPALILKNKSDQTSVRIPANMGIDASGENVLRVNFPWNMQVGEFEGTVEWGSKKAVLPDNFILKPGAIDVAAMPWVDARSARYQVQGYNFLPGKRYEVIIENDFVKPRKLLLDRKDYSNLELNIPAGLPKGSYKASLLVDSKPVAVRTYKYLYYGNFHIREDETQPILGLISQRSKKAFLEATRTEYYAAATDISRNEPVMTYVQKFSSNNAVPTLILRNITTKKEYSLTQMRDLTCIMDGAFCFNNFEISKEIPDGQYEAYVTMNNGGASEKYGQILNIR